MQLSQSEQAALSEARHCEEDEEVLEEAAEAHHEVVEVLEIGVGEEAVVEVQGGEVEASVQVAEEEEAVIQTLQDLQDPEGEAHKSRCIIMRN